MATVINMPRLSDTMTEGVVAKWHVKVGDKISEGTLLAEIETDKATMDFEAFPGQEGTLLFTGIDEGASAPVDSILAILGEEGEDISSYMSNGSSVSESKDSQEDEEVKLSQASPVADKKSIEAPEEKEELNPERLKASPLAKSLAKEKGIDITDVKVLVRVEEL
jgi:pyruvate dehydrogenase E2 component (dihydrolipoamide acetyltransferase)